MPHAPAMAALETVRTFFRREAQEEIVETFPAEAPVTELRFEASEAVSAALAAVGRTEDLRFSPDSKMIGMAAHVRNVLLLLRVHIELGESGPKVRIDDFAELTSPAFGGLHGMDWLDGETLATGNRDGRVVVVRIPRALGGRTYDAEVLRVIRAGKVRSNLFARPHSPGSLGAAKSASGQPLLLVCNNYKNRVTEHVLIPEKNYQAARHRVVMRRGITLPDGIAVSPDGRWVVVASHLTHEVLVWDRTARTNSRTPPIASLRGGHYPHGLRFSPDGRLWVTDAGSPYVSWYDGVGTRPGVQEPSGRVRVMDNETFEGARPNAREGGAKGIDVDSTGAVLAITCHQVPLRMYAVERLVEGAKSVV